MQHTLALYLHFPFCKQKCYYCDFNSFSGQETLIPEYFQALWGEMEEYLPQTHQTVPSVYFGGGTPSYLPAELLVKTLDRLKGHFFITPHTEITIEVNPGTATIEKFIELQAAGFNRLSIGLQARQDYLLEAMGRIHNWDDFETCYRFAREVGFDNIGVDLIFGLPRQSMMDWQETLHWVVEMEPEHISAYGLQLEPRTMMHRMVEKQMLTLPDEDLVADMMEYTMQYLPANGYHHYEISNYAKPGRESVHNQCYWECRDYLGFGAGAYSTVYGERWYNIKEPQKYIERVQKGLSPVAERELLGRRTAAIEALMLGLRTRAGVDLKQFREIHEVDLMRKARVELTNLFEEKLVDREGQQLFLTNKGIMVSNYVIGRLLKTFG